MTCADHYNVHVCGWSCTCWKHYIPKIWMFPKDKQTICSQSDVLDAPERFWRQQPAEAGDSKLRTSETISPHAPVHIHIYIYMHCRSVSRSLPLSLLHMTIMAQQGNQISPEQHNLRDLSLISSVTHHSPWKRQSYTCTRYLKPSQMFPEYPH